ncbi:MAG: helix-turn-helix domain-containing protein [Roseburia sp.]|nr:helix-turn-helix domain-containing protein [Roseburia sp.]
MTIGEQIQTLRIERGLTQERLAELLEISRQSVSKWELGQAVPDVDKIIRISELFDVSTDVLLLKNTEKEPEQQNPLHLGSIYLVVKDFEKSVRFYEKFFNTEVANRCQSGNKFVEFHIDNKCLSLMNEDNIEGHHTLLDSPYKFVQNYWVEDLLMEYERVRSLNIGKVSDILEAYPTYHYFHLIDPDNNVIEVTGGYPVEE